MARRTRFGELAQWDTSLLRDNGFTLLDTHADRGENTYYLARKSA